MCRFAGRMYAGAIRTVVEATSAGPSLEQERALDRAEPSLLRIRFVQAPNQQSALRVCRFVSRRAIVHLDPNPPTAAHLGMSVGRLLRGSIALVGRRPPVLSRIHPLHARYSRQKGVSDRLAAASACGRFDAGPTRHVDRAKDSPGLLPIHVSVQSRTARLGWTAACKESAGPVLREHIHSRPL